MAEPTNPTLQRESFHFNVVVESEARKVRAFGDVGLIPTTINRKKVLQPVGNIWVEPGYGDDTKDDFFFGSVRWKQDDAELPVRIDSRTLVATLYGMYGDDPAMMRLTVHKMSKAVMVTIEPEKRPDGSLVKESGDFEPVHFDTDASDYGSPTWEYFRFMGID